ncbi:MAG: radical SAM protein [Thermovirgaceae bacterium]|jgi:radical SAM superfamily enzyme YgiQ (UPF0313 family)|nr:radical SAM protein [Synergistales bacterium]
MYKDDTIYYPQDEANTVLLPVTTGCSYNRCAFCSMYKDTKYAPVPFPAIEAELRSGYLYTEKIFLTGADPLSIGYSEMKRILGAIHHYLPYCHRVASYASIRSISRYSLEELSVLHDAGLRLLYIGFESGKDDVLKSMKKGHTVDEAIEQARKLNEARLPFYTVIMYGIAGEGESLRNALSTAAMINRFNTGKVITMNLVVFYGAELDGMVKRGEFTPPGAKERLLEIRTLLESLAPRDRMVFDTTHPTNIIKTYGTLPEDRRRLLVEVDRHLDKA